MRSCFCANFGGKCWSLGWVLVVLWLLKGGAVAADDGFSRAPYVQLATPSGIQVVWRTAERMDPVVRYGLTMGELGGAVATGAIRERKVAKDEKELESDRGRLHSGPKGTRQYEAAVTGLQPDTRYYYAIYDGEKRLTPEDASYHFRTMPEAGVSKAAYFWVVGDSGTGKERQSEVHEAMLGYTNALGRPIDFYLHVGDMAYSKGTDEQFQEKFFAMYETTLRHTVVWPAIGNHEGASSEAKTGVGPYYDAYVCPTRGEAGGVASGHESYYSFDYGRIHFVVLNSFDMDRKSDGVMAAWLKEDLSRVDAEWLVAYWHHPPYSKGTHDTDEEKDSIEMRELILPILESHGVDLVLTGHSHIYERSMLMDGAYSTPTTVDGVILNDGDGDPESDGAYKKVLGLVPNQGTVQVVAGHGGTGVGRKGTMPVMKRVIVENGSVLVSINGDVLDAVMINFDGQERDHFQIRKEAGVVVERVADPVVLPPFQPPGKKLPRDYIALLDQGEEWSYHLCEGAPPVGWSASSYDDSAWLRATAGFGYGDDDDATVLAELPGFGDRLYVRRAFDVPAEMDLKQLGLGIRYDDAFIVYVNGEEVLRQGVGVGSGAEAREIADHEAGKEFEYFSLKIAEKFLRLGRNVVAIECHSIDSDEGDFTLEPFLVEELDSGKAGGESLPLVRGAVRIGEGGWRYSVRQEFEAGWRNVTFDDSAWKKGGMPMGYGKGYEVATSLREMEDAVTRVRFRHVFELKSPEVFDDVGLVMTWDDGFIAYLNGHEIGRAGVARGAGESAIGFGRTGAPSTRFFPFEKMRDYLVSGRNVIAIEGHNQAKDSSDYYMGVSFEKFWPVTWKKLPKEAETVIEAKAKWEYLGGEEPGVDWTTDRGWERDRAPFGFGSERLEKSLETKLSKMRGRFSRFYIRKSFELESEADFEGLGVILAWDDGVIGYLNGTEILRVGVSSGRGSEAKEIYRVQDAQAVYFPLTAFQHLMREGENQLAFEGHNHDRESSDFVLSPMLVRVDAKAVPFAMPEEVIEIIPRHARWRYHGSEQGPPADWNTLTFADDAWPEDEAGFGYGDGDDRTVLEMEDRYSAVYVRREFDVEDLSEMTGLGLGMRYDDGFIAYLNGREMFRVNVKEGRSGGAEGVRSIEAEAEGVAFQLDPFLKWLQNGRNVIAIEGHNSKVSSSDFTLDPFVFRAEVWPEE